MQITLTTTGRKSGRERPVTLYAWEDGDDLIVVGSWAGSARDPSWATNLRADPRATVKRGKRAYEVRAKEVAGSERERLWAMVVERFPMYARYQQKTDRQIPLFALARVEPTP
jgi:deazaflavin-dependent oxidoreductase (nitroreductase family)